MAKDSSAEGVWWARFAADARASFACLNDESISVVRLNSQSFPASEAVRGLRIPAAPGTERR